MKNCRSAKHRRKGEISLNTKSAHGSGSVLIRLGAALSFSCIPIGGSVSAAGTVKGFAAIFAGSLAACLFLFMASLAGSFSHDLISVFGKEQMQNDNCSLLLRIRRNPVPTCFFLIFSALFILQAALAVRFSGLLSAAALCSAHSVQILSDSVSFPLSAALFCLAVSAAVFLLFLLPRKIAFPCRGGIVIGAAVSALFLCGIFLFFGTEKLSPAGTPFAVTDSGFRLSFGEASALSFSVSLSWIPAFFFLSSGTRNSENHTIKDRMLSSASGAVCFLTGSFFLQSAGFFFFRHTGREGLTEIFSLPYAQFFLILFALLSAVTAVWFCIFSALKSSVTIYGRGINKKTLSAVLAAVSLLCALSCRTEHLENAHRFFTSFILPFLGICIRFFIRRSLY